MGVARRLVQGCDFKALAGGGTLRRTSVDCLTRLILRAWAPRAARTPVGRSG
jgi:hypothetical protein